MTRYSWVCCAWAVLPVSDHLVVVWACQFVAWVHLWAWSGLLISGLIRISFFLFLAVVITAVSVSTTFIFSAVFTFTATVEAR